MNRRALEVMRKKRWTVAALVCAVVLARSLTGQAEEAPTWQQYGIGIKRPINLVHMPVPRDRSDDDYFGPLANLRLRSETELCLGLVHYTDGIEGTKRRLATARKCAPAFSIATECGFGRRKPETIPELLRIHAAAAEID